MESESSILNLRILDFFLHSFISSLQDRHLHYSQHWYYTYAMCTCTEQYIYYSTITLSMLQLAYLQCIALKVTYLYRDGLCLSILDAHVRKKEILSPCNVSFLGDTVESEIDQNRFHVFSKRNFQSICFPASGPDH